MDLILWKLLQYLSALAATEVHAFELVLICHRARSHLVLMKVSEDRKDAFVELAGFLTENSATNPKKQFW